jgi:hypothetical protein
LASSIELADFDAVLFDLDGVLSATRAVHAAAWKHSFDESLTARDARHRTRTARFDESATGAWSIAPGWIVTIALKCLRGARLRIPRVEVVHGTVAA